MAAQMTEMPKSNEPMAQDVVLIYATRNARRAVLLDLSSTSGGAQLSPVAEHRPKLRDVTQSQARSCRGKQRWASRIRLLQLFRCEAFCRASQYDCDGSPSPSDTCAIQEPKPVVAIACKG